MQSERGSKPSPPRDFPTTSHYGIPLIWDGDFAHDFENGGLGWRWNNPVGVAIDFDTAPPSHGVRSLLLQFGGGINLDIIVPMQYVPVEPNRKYHFHAYMKTQGITTESGMRFSIQDPNHNNAVSLLTENLTGSHEWTAIDADVTTSSRKHISCWSNCSVSRADCLKTSSAVRFGSQTFH